MDISLKLTDESVFEDAIGWLKEYKRNNKIRTPALSLLITMMYYTSSIPKIDSLHEGIRRKDFELLADSIFRKEHSGENVRMIFTGSWKNDSSNPEVNNWRNPMDAQTGFRCDAPIEDLKNPEFVISERSLCPHRNNSERKCTLTGVNCHNPTKKRGKGSTDIPSTPKILRLDDSKFKMVPLSAPILRMTLGRASETIPLIPFLYALYYKSMLFDVPSETSIKKFKDDFSLNNEMLEALFDINLNNTINSLFIKELESKSLIETGYKDVSIEPSKISMLERLLDKLSGIGILIDAQKYIISKTELGYALHNHEFHKTFDLSYAARTLMSEPKSLSDRAQLILHNILSQSQEVRDSFRISGSVIPIKLIIDEDIFESNLDKAIKAIEDRFVAELEEAIKKDEVDIPVVDDRETVGRAEVKTRVGQNIMRKRCLSIYRNKCVICKLSIKDMLISSHIIPWNHREDTRLDQRNALCLCAFHDKAFDKGLITITRDEETSKYYLDVSEEMVDFLEGNKDFRPLFPKEIEFDIPEKFLPTAEFLQYHVEAIFRG